MSDSQTEKKRVRGPRSAVTVGDLKRIIEQCGIEAAAQVFAPMKEKSPEAFTKAARQLARKNTAYAPVLGFPNIGSASSTLDKRGGLWVNLKHLGLSQGAALAIIREEGKLTITPA